MAILLNHPAYDCVYLALAVENKCRFVTADGRLLRKVGEGHQTRFRRSVIGLTEAAGETA
jgi:predicted nucleic acid-binding protein